MKEEILGHQLHLIAWLTVHFEITMIRAGVPPYMLKCDDFWWALGSSAHIISRLHELRFRKFLEFKSILVSLKRRFHNEP